MEEIRIYSITPQELQDLIKSAIEQVMLLHKSEAQDKLISPNEAVKYYSPSISRQTLHTWTKQGLINSYSVGGKVFYKHSELMSSATKIKRYQTVIK